MSFVQTQLPVQRSHRPPPGFEFKQPNNIFKQQSKFEIWYKLWLNVYEKHRVRSDSIEEEFEMWNNMRQESYEEDVFM
jgi:hypothetical protein